MMAASPAEIGVRPERFLADAMLGRLARWLRILGYDTAYEKVISDDALLARAVSENRWLLTRDRYLARQRVLQGRHTLLVRDDLEGQLQELRQALTIELTLPHRRGYLCATCNFPLVPITVEAATPLVPPFVAESYRDFSQCPHCRYVFWPGTHWDDMCQRISAINSGTKRQAK
jgi:uncharacterized protein with PIN domain